MDTEVLVVTQLEQGQRLVTELVNNGFDVRVAMWVKTADDGPWYLYIGSKSVEPATLADAYRKLYTYLAALPDIGIDFSDIKLLTASDAIVLDAIAARDHHSGYMPVRFRGNRLGVMPIDDAYIYPRFREQMSQGEILQTLVSMANQDNPTPRSSFLTLQNGTKLHTLITGFSMQLPGGLKISTQDPSSHVRTQIPAEEIMSIQL